ncbi:MFS transporter [Staphylococcus sp. 18_1_E_LY]|uniref:MFS transporter n=1 Tax=Staphylococcus lloydii TaxID=2781774 RepID=UPI0018A098B5|nr:MFS transporter [Staphylococcus lloydii]MBF7019459.1 MFS transporter [Staphylococcus lloydii]MBF7027186.1 MFS transporter [Staphylococcus lloydii]
MPNLSPPIYALLIATFLQKFTEFLVIPFLSIYLVSQYHYSGFTVGTILAVVAITKMVMSFVASPFLDQYDKKVIIYVGLSICVISFASFPFIHNYIGFIAFSIFSSVGTSLAVPLYKALISILSPEDKKKLVFNLRYYLINLAAAFAPLLSTQWQAIGYANLFYAVALAYSINILVFMYTFTKFNVDLSHFKQATSLSFKQSINIFKNNISFVYLIAGAVFFVFGYNQMTVLLPQFFTHEHGAHSASSLYAQLVLVNGITVLTCQYFIYKIGNKVPTKNAVMIGGTLLPIGLFLLGTMTHIVLLVVAMFIFTIGEMFVFTMLDIRIDEISQEGLKGSYYSLAGLQNFGGLVAPLLGGYLLDVTQHGFILFGILAIITFMSVWMFSLSKKKEIYAA